jgi:hypothetical protein
MNKFQPGDIIRRINSIRYYLVKNSFEGFCQASFYCVTIDETILSKHALRKVNATIQIDDLNNNWIKEESFPEGKFKLKERVLFEGTYYSDALEVGTVVGYLPEWDGYLKNVIYTYYIKPDERPGAITTQIESLLKKHINTNKLWNVLCENSN